MKTYDIDVMATRNIHGESVEGYTMYAPRDMWEDMLTLHKRLFADERHIAAIKTGLDHFSDEDVPVLGDAQFLAAVFYVLSRMESER